MSLPDDQAEPVWSSFNTGL